MTLAQNQRLLDQQEDRSVKTVPNINGYSSLGSFIFQLATIADDITQWGASVRLRDTELRRFYPTEPTLAAAVYNTALRNASYSWTLEGPPRTVEQVQRVLHMANRGGGFQQMMMQVSTDVLTTDNGGFMEIVRLEDSPDSPVIGLNHLDSGRCRRTGNPDFPVVYTDLQGTDHKLRNYQVVTIADNPSPIEAMFGVGFCAVSRVLRMAQLMRDITVYMREKAAGRDPSEIHIVNGVKVTEIQDAVDQHRNDQRARGTIRYSPPVVLTTLDPSATVSVASIPLASLPDNFDFDTYMRWYINNLALAFGTDYQDFAPLPGRGIGTGTEALVLQMKARGKGPAGFMKAIEYAFNFHGVVPRTVTFRYDEPDVAQDLETADLEKRHAETDKVYVETAVLDPQAVRQRMLDRGEISQEEFDRLQAVGDITPNTSVQDSERATAPEQQGQPQTTAQDGERVPEAATKGLTVEDPAGELRLDYERQMSDRMGEALAASFEDLRKRITGRRKSLPWIVGIKAIEDIPGLPDNAEWFEVFRLQMIGTMLPFSRNIPNGGASWSESLGLGVDLDRVNQQVLDLSKVYTDDWWASIAEVTRESMRSAIVTWQESGLGTEGLDDLVAAIEPLFGRARAERIAATEVTRLFDEGNRLAHISAGIETEQWQTVRDELVCPICKPLDKKKFPIGEGTRPPAHVNCRCMRLPVVNNRALWTAED